ncbi:MAG: hypothetical protein R3D27_15195 [Hyphomicrobiaceae bacterium]
MKSPMLRFLAINCAVGTLVAVMFVAGLFWLNVGGLRDVLLQTHEPVTAVILLTAGCIITFGSAAMGTAVMLLPRDKRSWDEIR